MTAPGERTCSLPNRPAEIINAVYELTHTPRVEKTTCGHNDLKRLCKFRLQEAGKDTIINVAVQRIAAVYECLYHSYAGPRGGRIPQGLPHLLFPVFILVQQTGKCKMFCKNVGAASGDIEPWLIVRAGGDTGPYGPFFLGY